MNVLNLYPSPTFFTTAVDSPSTPRSLGLLEATGHLEQWRERVTKVVEELEREARRGIAPLGFRLIPKEWSDLRATHNVMRRFNREHRRDSQRSLYDVARMVHIMGGLQGLQDRFTESEKWQTESETLLKTLRDLFETWPSEGLHIRERVDMQAKLTNLKANFAALVSQEASARNAFNDFESELIFLSMPLVAVKASLDCLDFPVSQRQNTLDTHRILGQLADLWEARVRLAMRLVNQHESAVSAFLALRSGHVSRAVFNREVARFSAIEDELKAQAPRQKAAVDELRGVIALARSKPEVVPGGLTLARLAQTLPLYRTISLVLDHLEEIHGDLQDATRDVTGALRRKLRADAA